LAALGCQNCLKPFDMLKEIAHKDLNDVMKMLKEALNRVENIYIEQEYSRVRAGFQNPENAFMSELYHQFRILHQDNDSLRALYVNTDMNKQMYGINRKKIECLNNFFRQKIRPDLILHGGQNDLKNQKLVCEIKTNKKLRIDKFVIDLQKLVYYKISRLIFENSVFIYTGELSRIQTLLNELHKRNSSSLIDCLHKHCILFALPKSKENNTYQWGIYAIDLGNGINERCFDKIKP
jgi:hypothetical protein